MYQMKIYIIYVFSGLTFILSEDDPRRSQVETVFQKCGRKKRYMGIYRKETEGQHYLRTGRLGDYETAKTVGGEISGRPVSLFDDSELKNIGDSMCLERRMMVKGKSFVVRSVFPEEAPLTPTDKMLELIDTDIKKDARQS